MTAANPEMIHRMGGTVWNATSFREPKIRRPSHPCSRPIRQVILKTEMELAAKDRKERKNNDFWLIQAMCDSLRGETACCSKPISLSSLRSFAANHFPFSGERQRHKKARHGFTGAGLEIS